MGYLACDGWNKFISPKLFSLALEDVCKMLLSENKVVNVDSLFSNHLRFANNIVIISSDIQ